MSTTQAITPEKLTGVQTANKALDVLVTKNEGYHRLTPKQKKVILSCFKAKGKDIPPASFDIVKLNAVIDLSNPVEVKKNLSKIMLYEIKSTRLNLDADFIGYWGSVTASEYKSASLLPKQYRFILVNTATGSIKEITVANLRKCVTNTTQHFKIK